MAIKAFVWPVGKVGEIQTDRKNERKTGNVRDEHYEIERYKEA